jgi:hypothetical protein
MRTYFTLFFTLCMLPFLAMGQESVRVWDGTNFAGVNTDGSVTVKQGVPGTPWPVTMGTPSAAWPVVVGNSGGTAAVQVQGNIAEAETYGGNPLLMGGVDYGDNKAYFAEVDGASGRLSTDTTGTVTCNAGTNLNTSTLATSALQTTLNGYVDGLEGYVDGVETLLTNINNKLVSGTDIGDVTINNSTGASAVNIQDGGNTITVDGTVALGAGSAAIGTVNTGQLLWISSASSDVDNSAVTVFDCSAADSTTKAISVTNAGTGDLFVRVGATAPVADGSTAYYDFKLALGETRWLPFGYKASSTVNDVQVIRAAAQTNDNVIVALYAWGN